MAEGTGETGRVGDVVPVSATADDSLTGSTQPSFLCSRHGWQSGTICPVCAFEEAAKETAANLDAARAERLADLKAKEARSKLDGANREMLEMVIRGLASHLLVLAHWCPKDDVRKTTREYAKAALELVGD